MNCLARTHNGEPCTHNCNSEWDVCQMVSLATTCIHLTTE